jgi:hypothetical protein
MARAALHFGISRTGKTPKNKTAEKSSCLCGEIQQKKLLCPVDFAGQKKLKLCPRMQNRSIPIGLLQ